MANGTEFIKLGQLTRFYNNLLSGLGGKRLSTNDFTNELKTQYDAAQANVVETIKVNNTALTPSEKAVNIEVPTNVSDLNNDSQFITAAVQTLTNFYDKTTIDTLETTLRGLITNAESGKLSKSIVQALPAVGEASDTTIYMVPNTRESGGNIYDEYMLINGAFEALGTTKIELDGYVKSSELTYATDSDIDAIFSAS